MKTVEKLTCETWHEMQTEHEILETSSLIRLTHWSGSNTIHLLDTTNALKVGKECQGFSIEVEGYQPDHLKKPVINVLHFLGWNLRNAFEYMKLKDNPLIHDSERGITYRVRPFQTKAIRVFTPVAVKNLKPLDKRPTHWNLTHAIRALVNGQFEKLECNGHYTDDYAFDNAVNFQRGAIADGLAFAAKIIESPSGWWTSLQANNEVSICCHSFDSNSFTLNLERN